MNILDVDEAYSDFSGERELSYYNPKTLRFIPTTDPHLKIALSNRFSDIQIYLVHDDKPVGTFFFRKFERNNFGHVDTVKNLYIPSSYLLPDFRGKKLGKMLYKWMLDAGISLINCEGQSPFSHALWLSLAKEYDYVIVNCRATEILHEGVSAIEHAQTKDAGSVLLSKKMSVAALRNYLQ